MCRYFLSNRFLVSYLAIFSAWNLDNYYNLNIGLHNIFIVMICIRKIKLWKIRKKISYNKFFPLRHLIFVKMVVCIFYHKCNGNEMAKLQRDVTAYNLEWYNYQKYFSRPFFLPLLGDYYFFRYSVICVR